jgi:hypothetical protein
MMFYQVVEDDDDDDDDDVSDMDDPCRAASSETALLFWSWD